MIKISVKKRGEKTQVFKYKNKILVEIDQKKDLTYHCFLKTSSRGGLGADYASYNAALTVAAKYIGGLFHPAETFYFDYAPGSVEI